MTYMWKYETGIFAYQTDDKIIADKMERREKFLLFNEGMNCNHWVYHTDKRSTRNALSTLKTLSGIEPKYRSFEDIWEC